MKLRLISLLLIMVCLMSACAQKGAAPSSDESVIAQGEQELNVFVSPHTKWWLDNRIDGFRSLYPSVQINITAFEGETAKVDYEKKLQATLMAGNGPDLVFLNGTEFSDVNKVLLQSGIFSDLTELYQSDASFNIADYDESAWKAGNIDGKQLCAPICYSLPIVLTDSTRLADLSFDYQKPQSYVDFINASLSLTQKGIPQDKIFYQNDLAALQAGFISYAGISLADYNAETGIVDIENFKNAAECAKRIGKLTHDGKLGLYKPADALCSKEALFVVSRTGGIRQNTSNASKLKQNGQVPVFFPLISADKLIHGTLELAVAIPEKSQNKQAAFNFIKLMLSDVCQMSDICMMNFPVNKKSVAASLEHTYATLDAPCAESLEKILSAPKKLSFLAGSVEKMLAEAMAPYFNDSASIDDCIKNYNQSVEFYLSE